MVRHDDLAPGPEVLLSFFFLFIVIDHIRILSIGLELACDGG